MFSNAVQNAVNEALILTAARFNVDDILTRDIAGFQDAVQQRVGDLAEREHLGVAIDQVQVQSVAPRQLKDVFAMVTTARQNRDKLINDALSEQNRIASQAGAAAASITTPPNPRAPATSPPSSRTRRRSPNCCRNTKATRTCSRNWNWPRQ